MALKEILGRLGLAPLTGLKEATVNLEDIGCGYKEFESLAREYGIEVHWGGRPVTLGHRGAHWNEQPITYRSEDAEKILALVQSIGTHAVDVWPHNNLNDARGVDLSYKAQKALIDEMIKNGTLK